MDQEISSLEDSKAKPKHDYSIMIDKQKYSWSEQYITGTQIKNLAGVDQSYGVWMKVHGSDEDPFVEDDEQLDLNTPGTEKFFTGKKQTTEG